MSESNQGIFINGKKQIIDMLKIMPRAEREKLLKNINLRNPAMAKELSAKSLGFSDVLELEAETLRQILNFIHPSIIGLALHSIDQRLQRKALSSMNRELAQEAFEVMSGNIGHRINERKKAQDKIVQTALSYGVF